MEDNSFIPFQQNEHTFNQSNKNSSRHRIVKNRQVRTNGRYRIHSDSPQTSEMQCIPVKNGGRVEAIEVHCTCGCQTTVQLEYGE